MKPLLLHICLLLPAFTAYCQTALKILPDPLNGAICPKTNKYHSVVAESGPRPACTYTWTVSGGSIEGPSIGTGVYVKWNDLPGQGTLTVRTSRCTDSDENGSEVTATYTRLSVFGQSFPNGACNNSIDVPLCSNAAITVCADKMYIQDTGGVGEPPLKEVDAYLFTIPSGWRQLNTTNTGPITITSTVNSIQIEPISTNGGTVTVIGTVTNTCGQTVANSNPKTITINRTPAVSMTSSAGSNYVAWCGLRNPVSFTVTPVSCAVSYTWSIPSGWSGTSSTNTIEVTPNGSNAGTVSVSIALNTGYTKSVAQTIPYSNAAPASIQPISVNGYLELCAGESLTFTTTLPPDYPSNFGFDWYADAGVYINGSPSAHTSTNSATITVAGQAYGHKYIYTRVNNLTCTPGNYGHLETRVGTYSSQEFSIIGPSEVCPNTVADYLSSYISSDVTYYQWSAPNGWSYSGQGTPYFSVSVPWSLSGGEAITLRLGNRCGYTNTPYVLWLSSGYCGFSMSPNPVSNTLTVTDLILDEGETAEATLVDENNELVSKGRSKGGKIELDVSRVPNGKYIVLVYYKGKVESKNVFVRH